MFYVVVIVLVDERLICVVCMKYELYYYCIAMTLTLSKGKEKTEQKFESGLSKNKIRLLF